MPARKVSDGLVEKNQAVLSAVAERRFGQQQARFKHDAPKRELAERLLLKLVKGDQELERLLKQSRDVSAKRAKNGVKLQKAGRQAEKKFDVIPNLNPNFPSWINAIEDSFTLTAPWAFAWARSSAPSDPAMAAAVNIRGEAGEDEPSGFISLDVQSGRGNPFESGIAAIGNPFQPPKSGLMNVSANPNMSYQYDGNHTSAWVGFYITEWTQDNTFVGTSVAQQTKLWDLYENAVFSGTTQLLLAAQTPVVSDHVYAIEIWAGATAEGPSTELSSTNMEVGPDSISIVVT